uniref:FeS assembly SUF system protein n=1 Tax=Candidatus Kentrum sp. MB TaxID=2138164 RepID=A0A450XFE2_9GAMM|nr:MAG: FeS assembly SUF system protein [Candidatus Kentron sp. MB]VFK29314.1 MAG: FeS assembly SUF system protein [Candidatus Kentron sp. MB]VFK74745.1 MAG: FeS assembly SUF system protein [Candidatus Kentron sp. MB]
MSTVDKAERKNKEAARQELKEAVICALRQVYDPEIPVNIYDLGLIYRVDISTKGMVYLDMTLTAPGCPVAETFPGAVEAAVRSVPGVFDARVTLVWDPPWTTDNMSDETKLELGLL